ncbi:hypothetical protein [Dipodfec virus UOA04_Rod_907]|nr:hypothetical protein [Dipodfec virus UOA04_Rod_907]
MKNFEEEFLDELRIGSIITLKIAKFNKLELLKVLAKVKKIEQEKNNEIKNIRN